MKFNGITLLIFFTLVLPAYAYPQDPHVSTKYMKESKQTRVSTDFMFAIDTPSQFLQVQLSFRYPNQQLLKPPRRIALAITSYTREVLYRREADRKFLIIADGDSLRFNATSYQLLKGETKNGKDRFWFEWDSTWPFPAGQVEEIFKGLGYESPLPDGAQIRAGKNVDGVFMERIFVELKSERLLEIAKVHKLEFQLGNTKFGFTENQMNTIRDFAEYVTP